MAPRRDAQEHITVARLYPDVKHVYVEGRTDARYIVVSAGHPKSCDVHPIEDVDFDLDDEQPSPFLSGCRGKVVALGQAFQGKLKSDNARFLVDKDHEDEHPIIPYDPAIVITDFSNFFVGELDFEWVRDSMYLAIGAAISLDFWSRIISSCLFLFAYRSVKQSQFPRAHFPNPANFIVLSDGLPSLDEEQFCANAVTSPYIPLTGVQLHGQVLENLAEKTSDPRHYINSDDLLTILHSFIRRAKLASNVSRDAIKSALLLSLPKPSANQPRLQMLLQWMTG